MEGKRPRVLRRRPPVAALPPGDPIVLIDRPSFTQATIRLAAPGIARSHPDYEPLNVLNMVLGRSFNSRLMKNLREQRGAAYHASSSFSADAAPDRSWSAARYQPRKPAIRFARF